MSNLIFAVPVILIIATSIFVVKIAAVALKMTGLDEKRAYFQALSAFTGTGFTTSDSEVVLQNDIRRRIIMILMILGNAGFITVITTVVISFERANPLPLFINVGILLVVIFLLVKFLANKRVAKFLNEKIESRLEKRPPFHKRPVEEVLRIAKDYGIAEVSIKNSCRDLGKTLSESDFRENDILILAIERRDSVIPAPKATDRILMDDTLICYGRLSNIEKIIAKE